jgi:subtilisin family serine protease
VALAAAALFLLGFSVGGGVPPLPGSAPDAVRHGVLPGSGAASARSGRAASGRRLEHGLTADADSLRGGPGGGGALSRPGRGSRGSAADGRRGVRPRSLPDGDTRGGGNVPFLRGGLEVRRPPAPSAPPPVDDSSPIRWGAPNWPGEVLLRPAADLPPESLTALADFFDASLDPRSSGCVLIRGLPVGVTEKEWSRFLEREGLARAAYPNFRCWPCWVPNDPELGQQWHVTKVRLPEAWDLTTGDASLVIAVCDTGIDTDHIDLVAKIGPGQNVADDPDSTDVEDYIGHGTSVAGMAAAVTDNSVQTAGAAPTCIIMPVKISNLIPGGEATLADMIDGIAWAHNNGAHVVNCSYNGPPDTDFYDAMDDEGLNAEANGAVLVMAAGNNDMDMGPDKPWDHVLWIGSTDSDDTKSSFSQYGWALDLTAPGYAVHITQLDDGSGLMSGTSFASPLVAGAMGLMYAASSYALTPAEYKAALYASCEDLGDAGKDDVFGHGRLDAYAAVIAVATPTASASANPTSGNAPLNVSFSGSSSMDGLKTLTYSWDFGDGEVGGGKNTSHIYTEAGSYTVTLTVEDSEGLGNTDTLTVDVNYGNLPSRMHLWIGQRVDYLFDPTGGAGAVTVTLTGGSLPPGLSLAANRLTGEPTQRGTWDVTLEVDDGTTTQVQQLQILVTLPGFCRFRRDPWR